MVSHPHQTPHSYSYVAPAQPYYNGQYNMYNMPTYKAHAAAHPSYTSVPTQAFTSVPTQAFKISPQPTLPVKSKPSATVTHPTTKQFLNPYQASTNVMPPYKVSSQAALPAQRMSMNNMVQYPQGAMRVATHPIVMSTAAVPVGMALRAAPMAMPVATATAVSQPRSVMQQSIVQQEPDSMVSEQAEVVGQERLAMGSSSLSAAVNSSPQSNSAETDEAVPLRLGALVPDFDVQTTEGDNTLHNLLDRYPFTILMTHPNDFSPVGTTEMAMSARFLEEFHERGVDLIGLSCDSVEDHHEWIRDICAYEQLDMIDTLGFSIISDQERTIVTKLGLLDPRETDEMGVSRPARACIVIDSNKAVRLVIIYPANTGRNFNELLRIVDSLNLTDQVSVATGANWINGEPCLVLPEMSSEEAEQHFGSVEFTAMPSQKDYMRTVDQPEIAFEAPQDEE
jgi:1-Cys peroxiredoxin 6